MPQRPTSPPPAQHPHALDAAHTALEALCQGPHSRAYLLDAALLDVGESRAQAGRCRGR